MPVLDRGLEFDEAAHIYRYQGQIVPSVTQVLEDVGICDYSYLPHETREMALQRGSAVHVCCEAHDAGWGRDSDVDERILPYLDGWRRFLAESEFVIEQIEHRGFNQVWGYAGTLDRRGRLNGRPTVIDLKTNQVPDWTRMQLAAYVEFEKFPTIVDRIAVELHSDTTYRLVSIPAQNHFADFNDFCYALRVYRLKRLFNRNLEKKILAA